MTQLKWTELKGYVVDLVKSGRLVFVGVHTNNWFDFAGRLVQATGYFCHVFYCVYIDGKGRLLTIEADGKKVAWHDFDEYANKIKSGNRELTIGYIDATPEQKKNADIEARSQVGHNYDDGENKWQGIVEVISWFGNVGKLISGQLDKIKNPMGSKEKFNCSESCTRICRYVNINIVKQNPDPKMVTPAEFMNDILLKKDFKSIKD
jgi:hypothetical protein